MQPESPTAPAPGRPRRVAPDGTPRPPLSLRRNFSWTFAGNFVYAGCQWGMLMVMAKLGTPEMVGQFAMGLAVTAPVILFANLHLRGVQATDARGEFLFGDYLALRLLTTAVALAVIAVIALGGGYREVAPVILAVGATKALEAISDAFYGLLQHRERMDMIARSMMIKGPTMLAALGATVRLTGSCAWGAAALAGTGALVLITYDIPAGLRVLRQGHGEPSFRLRWEPARLVRLARLALPLGFVMMLISLNANIPRYLIRREGGDRQLGLFAAMAYLVVAGDMVVAALGQAASPRLARLHATGDRPAFRRLLLRLVGLGALGGAAAVVAILIAGRELLNLIYSSDYAAYADVLAWIMAAAALGFVASFLGYGLTATRNFGRFVLPFCVVTTVAAASAALLIPRFGLAGAAWSMGATNLTSIAVTLILLSTPARRQT